MTGPTNEPFAAASGYPQPGYPAAPKTNDLATASLVAGIVGLSVVPVIGAIVAIVLGHRARCQIRQTGQPGSGMALAGLITGYLGLLMTTVSIVIILLIANSSGEWLATFLESAFGAA